MAYSILEANMERLEKKLTRIQNKCKKFGCSFTYEKVGEEFKTLKDDRGVEYQANAFVCLMIDNAAMKIYVFDEWYRTGVTNKIIAQAIKDKGYGGQRIVCDSAEPKSISELQEEGIKAEPSRKGKDSVNDGIRLIENYEIIVHEKNCPEFKKEIQNYCWETDKDGKPTDKPDHEFSHGMDSMRYATGKVLVGDTFSFD